MLAAKKTKFEFKEGSIVRVINEDLNGYDYKGIFKGVVIDCDSQKDPGENIAVFFDREIKSIQLGIVGFKDKYEIPTKDNYQDNPRVLCYSEDDLELAEEFSIVELATRTFPSHIFIHSISKPKFDFVPNSHKCQFEKCESGKLATKLSFVNCWGSVMTVYCCEECYKKSNGMLTDSVRLADPLPGYVED